MLSTGNGETVPESLIQEAFDVFDVDGDGQISLSELRVMLSGGGAAGGATVVPWWCPGAGGVGGVGGWHMVRFQAKTSENPRGLLGDATDDFWWQ